MGFFRNSYMGIDVGFDSIRVVELRVKASQVQVSQGRNDKDPTPGIWRQYCLSPSISQEPKNSGGIWG